MGLKIIAGRSKTGKSTYIYDEINHSINNKKDENLILIVPEQMTYQAEYEIIDRLKSHGIMDVEILSFKRLSYKVFEEVGGLKIQEIDTYGKIMLLKKIFEENIKELQVYRNASKQDGFLKEFDLLIKELKQNSISIEFLENINKFKIKNKLLKMKLQDIIKIYKKMNEETKNKYFDEEDKTDLFIQSIEYSNYIKNSTIWIDGFDSFDNQRVNIIKKLITFSKEVTISLNIDPLCIENLELVEDYECFKVTYDILNTFNMFNCSENNKTTIIPLYKKRNMSQEIELIEKNMFTINTESHLEKTDNISIYSSMNPYTEAEKTASKIVSLVQKNNYRWKDITVCVGDMDSYNMVIKKIFTQYEIPYFMDAKRNIMDNPLTKYILSLLDMFIWNFKYDDVFEYLKTGFTSINYDQISKLENFCLQYGIEGEKWFRKFTYKAKNTNYYDELRNKFTSGFKQFKKEFNRLDNALDITLFIFNFIKENKVQEKTEKQVEVFKKTGMYEMSSEYAQVWNYVMDIFEQITLVGEDIKISPKEYRKIIESGFNEIKISIIPPTIDKISIKSIDKAALGKSRAIFIMGANEENLGFQDNEKGILLDDERDNLLELGMKLTNSLNYNIYKQKHMLYKVFSSATEKLYMSYPLGTTEGKTLQPSTYIERLKQIFPLLVEETDLNSTDGIENVSNQMGTIDNLTSKIRNYIEGSDINDIWKDVYLWYEKNETKIFDIINRGINYSNKVDKIEKEYIEKIYKMPLTMTVSKLESQAKCPFSYFMDNIIKPLPRRVQKIEYYDLGNIYHRAVEEFTNEITKNNTDINIITQSEIYSLAEKCTEKVLLEKKEEINALEANERNKYMKNKITRLVNRATYTIIEQLKRGNFKPEFTELKIGEHDKDNCIEPLKIKISEEESIFLRGRIDRVDIMKKENLSYINIIDYKSSQYDIDLSDVMQGLQLQLLIYMSSLINGGKHILGSDAEVGGAFYFCIDDPMVDGDNLKNKKAEDEIFSKLSLKGYVLEDLEVINNMDNLIDENKASDIIPVSFKVDGNIKKTSKTLTKKEFSTILDKTNSKAKEISKDILDGVIDILPYKKGSGESILTPCTYCDYKSVCQFDVTVPGNNYRKINKLSKEEILNEIVNQGGDNKDELD